MEIFLQIVEATPWWVYLIIAYLFVIAFRATRPRTLTITQLFATPIAVTIWSAFVLIEQWQGPLWSLFPCLIPIALGIFFGWHYVKHWRLKFFHKPRSVMLPPTYSTIALTLSIFAIRYSFGVYAATHSFIPYPIFLADLGASTFILGIFIGRLLNIWSRFKQSLR